MSAVKAINDGVDSGLTAVGLGSVEKIVILVHVITKLILLREAMEDAYCGVRSTLIQIGPLEFDLLTSGGNSSLDSGLAVWSACSITL